LVTSTLSVRKICIELMVYSVGAKLIGGYFKFKMVFIPWIDIKPSKGMFFKHYVNYHNFSALFSKGFQRCIFLRIRFLKSFFNFQQSRRQVPVSVLWNHNTDDTSLIIVMSHNITSQYKRTPRRTVNSFVTPCRLR
jgi:hypothetical protein